MFRSISQPQGLAVDVDSFCQFSIVDWLEINKIIDCVFLTTDNTLVDKIKYNIPQAKIILLEKCELLFAPNLSTHKRVLNALGIESVKLAYLSCNFSFLKNAHAFLSGTIWITDEVTYQQASASPDIIIESVSQLKDELSSGLSGFLGERAIESTESISSANIITVNYAVDGEAIPFYVLGRYFKGSNYIHQIHPYSVAINYNKKCGVTFGVFDSVFAKIYSYAINWLKKSIQIDAVLAVPVKPSKKPRFNSILDSISVACGIENVGSLFSCIRDYPDQKQLSAEEREKNINGAFVFNGSLKGKSVVLIDDISSTGSTIQECVRELRNHEATQIIVLLLAINQLDSGYWSSDIPHIKCTVCDSNMELHVSRQRKFFYSCLDCYHAKRNSRTLNYALGLKKICDFEQERIDSTFTETSLFEDFQFMDDSETVYMKDIECPICHNKTCIDIRNDSQESRYERPMGTNLLIQLNTFVVCNACGKKLHINGNISFYPLYNIESDDTTVSLVD